MDNAKQLWEYVNQNRDKRFLKLNEEGKRAYLQYGYDNKLLKPEELTDKAMSYITPSKPKKTVAAKKTNAINPLDRSQERYINPELGRSDAVLAGLLGGLTLGVVGKNDSDFQKLQEEHPIAQGAGYIAGMAAPFSGAAKVTAPLTKGLTNKIGSEVGKRAVSGIIPGAIIDTATGAIAGERGTDLAKRVGEGAVLGAVGDVALYGIGRVGKVVADRLKIGKLEKIPVQEIATTQTDIKPGTKIQSKGTFKIRNTNLDKAYTAYNEAIETIQNHFGTNELRTNEMAKIKTELGIDLDKLVADIEQAEKGIDIKAIGEQRNLANAAGVKITPKINAPEGSITNRKIGNINTPLDTKTSSVGQNRKSDILKIDFDTIDDTVEIENNIKALQEYKTEIQTKLQTAKPEEISKLQTDLLKVDLQLFSAEQKLKKAPLKINQANVAAEKPFTKQTPVQHGNADILKEIDTELEGAAVKPNSEIAAIAPTLRDAKLGLSYSLTDVYRNFKYTFGKNYDIVKKQILDPFDKAKKSYVDTQKTYTDDLYNNVVKKLGIGKDTKLSSAVQWYGEGKKIVGAEPLVNLETGQKKKVAKTVAYTLDDLKKEFPDKWHDIVEADKWFRKSYDELIDKINESRRKIYPNNPEKLVGKRTDYYRHFRELADTFQGIKNLFDTPANIDPKLVGVSEFTQPKSRWASFMQERGRGPYKADAVGGFLDYIKAASYAINIDPQINVFRGLAKDIAETTGDSKNANNFILFLRNFANDLAGKSNPLDRPIQDQFNRKVFNVINWANGRVKKNTVLYNLRSALSQFANVPQGVAKIKNPVSLVKGFGDMAAGLIGQGKAPDLYNQSQFISERYSSKLFRRFDTKILEQPEKFASWLLETADGIGTKFIWNSAYNEAISRKVADPIKYADDLTRSLVAGRGVGEVPLMQKSKLFQLVAPFQIEVTNLWNVMRDMVNEKDFGAIATLFVANYLLNEGMEKLTGSGVTFDPIGAIKDAIKEKDMTPGKVAGRLGGEVLSNIPLGQTIAAQLPEDMRTEYLGRNDPTRFGSGLLLTKGIQDPLFKLAAPGGGAQIKKTYEGAKAINEDIPGVYGKNPDGEKYLKYLVDNENIGNVLKGLIFGKSAFNEAQEYYETNARPLSADQTNILVKLVAQGKDVKESYDSIMLKRRINALNSLIRDSAKGGLTDKEKTKINKEIVSIKDLVKKLKE